MGSLREFAQHMDWWGLVTLFISAVAALLCITLHELSHGFVAYRLGDPPPKTPGGSPSIPSSIWTSWAF